MLRLALCSVALIAMLALALTGQPPLGPVEKASACTLTHSNIQVSNDPNQAGAVVNYGPPSTTGGDCGTITCSPASGSFFPLGTTEVVCSATPTGVRDSFLIKVVDTQPPTVTAPPNRTVGNDPGLPSALVKLTPPTASDNAPGVTASCDRPVESVFPLGLAKVVCTSKDAAGNTATASYTVTVKDTEAPRLRTPSAVTAVAAAAATTAKVDFTTSASDNSGASIDPVCAPSSGGDFPIGTTQVLCVAQDGAANAAVATFPVTVTRATERGLRVYLALVQGQSIVYAVSEDAAVTISLVRCLNKACSKTQPVATLGQDAKEGRNSIRIPKRSGGKAIAGGSYRATVTAKTATGGASALAVKFRLRR